MDNLEQARRTMEAAASKATGQLDSFKPYLRAAIAYWRLQEEAAQKSGDLMAQVDAVTQRINCEDDFRRVVGRSYHTLTDAISYDEVSSLPNL